MIVPNVTWPLSQLPMYLMVDDGAPLLNLDHWEQPHEEHVPIIPNHFLHQFVEGIGLRGLRGKFTVLPYPMGLGRIDQSLPGIAAKQREEFLITVRDELEPFFDITPEILTHLNALDIRHHLYPLPFPEKRMMPYHDVASLTQYFRIALEILTQAGLHPAGMTSPGTFGIEAEERYAEAVIRAFDEQRRVAVPFYYLHTDSASPVVVPRVQEIDGNVAVHLPSSHGDPLWPTKYGRPSTIDALLDPRGQSGRIRQLVVNRSPIGFHTHWSSLYSDGTSTGLKELFVLVDRIHEHFGPMIRWIRCSELAQYTVGIAQTHVTAHESESGIKITVDSRGTVPLFTLTCPNTSPLAVTINGKSLRQAASQQSNAWWESHGDTVLSWDLTPPSNEILITLKRSPMRVNGSAERP